MKKNFLKEKILRRATDPWPQCLFVAFLFILAGPLSTQEYDG